MALLDQNRLSVSVSAKDATYGERSWIIRGDSGSVRVARRTRAFYSPLSGLGHRRPIEMVDGDGAVLCTVRRSKALKGEARTYTVTGPDNGLLATIRHSHDTGEAGSVNYFEEFVGPTDEVLATSIPLVGKAGTGLVGPDHDWPEIEATIRPKQAGWPLPATHTVAGLEALHAELRVIVAAFVTVQRPWRSGERAASRKTSNVQTRDWNI